MKISRACLPFHDDSDLSSEAASGRDCCRDSDSAGTVPQAGHRDSADTVAQAGHRDSQVDTALAERSGRLRLAERLDKPAERSGRLRLAERLDKPAERLSRLRLAERLRRQC